MPISCSRVTVETEKEDSAERRLASLLPPGYYQARLQPGGPLDLYIRTATVLIDATSLEYWLIDPWLGTIPVVLYDVRLVHVDMKVRKA